MRTYCRAGLQQESLIDGFEWWQSGYSFPVLFCSICPHVSLSFFPPSSVNACFSFSVFCHRYACFLCFHVGSLILFSECVLACMPHVALVWTLLKFFSCFWFPDFVIWTSPFCSFPACLCVFHLQTYRMLVMKTMTYISYILLFDTKLGVRNARLWHWKETFLIWQRKRYISSPPDVFCASSKRRKKMRHTAEETMGG